MYPVLHFEYHETVFCVEILSKFSSGYNQQDAKTQRLAKPKAIFLYFSNVICAIHNLEFVNTRRLC